ncbi:hypothetical protein JTB14_029380 [Gonioctena quinquepunctata]|nr:hypothetical protein JTB14_029380 [Gonioctena quinquepunctata]
MREWSVTMNPYAKVDRAPGQGNIQPEIMKDVALNNPEYVLAVYNVPPGSTTFPEESKRARLLLPRKAHKPIENLSFHRSPRSLSIEKKLFELLILPD